MDSSTKIATKELILETAFSFYEKIRIVDFSMSELAAKVGISKPAIYRHFKNKEALLDAMFAHFLDKLSVPLIKAQSLELKNANAFKYPFTEIVGFLAESPKYINYFINCCLIYDDFVSLVKKGLLTRGFKSHFEEDGFEILVENLYCIISLIFFIKCRIEIKKYSKKVDSIEVFSEKLVDFILGGLEKHTEITDLIHPIKISDERIKEIDKFCEIKESEFPEEDKFFIALANVIKKYTVNGVTIERIANEMNLAKSSLYFYFENKSELIKTQIERELAILGEFCRENGVEAKNYSEFCYITMKSELEYFRVRPSILYICGWLLQDSTEGKIGKAERNNNVWEKRIGKILLHPDFGFEAGPEVLTFWIGVIPVALFLYSEKRKMPYEKLSKIIKRIFNFIQFGIK